MGEFCLLLLTGFRVQFQKFTQSEEYGAMQCNIEWLEHQFLDSDGIIGKRASFFVGIWNAMQWTVISGWNSWYFVQRLSIYGILAV